MAERRCIDEDGHCSICGYAIDMESETMESHECPPGFTQPPHDDLTAERAEGLYNRIADECLDKQVVMDYIAQFARMTRQEALREAARVVETITLQAVKAELRWREKHAVEEVEGVAKSERAECYMRSLGLHIKGELDRLASEGASAPIDLLPKLKDDGSYGEHF